MGRQIKGLLYFYITDARHSFFVFWFILMSTLAATILIGSFLKDFEMAFSLPFAIYIYGGIFGFVSVKESVPFSIKMGATRKNIFVSLGIFFLLLAFVKSVLASTLHLVVMEITKKTGMTFLLIHPAQLISDTWLNRVFVDTIVLFLLLSLMYLLGLLVYKYGLLGGGSMVGAFIIVFLLGMGQGWLIDFIVETYHSMDYRFLFQVLLIGIIIYGLTWTMLRHISTVKAR
ncbi:hypothetical protein RZN22_02140 [Bacillaceae bacterium S4-13-58]